MKLSKITFLLLLATISSLWSCASKGPIPPLSNVNATQELKTQGTVAIGPFIDHRQGTGGDIKYIGTIRGGFGNPVERLYLDEGVSEFVKHNVSKCLWYNNIKTEELPQDFIVYHDGHFSLKKPNKDPTAPPILVGLIHSLQAKHRVWGGSRYFEVKVDIYLISQTTGMIIWEGNVSNSTNNSKYSGKSGIVGISDNIEPTRQWLDTLIQDKGIDLFSTNPKNKNEFFNTITYKKPESQEKTKQIEPLKKELNKKETDIFITPKERDYNYRGWWKPAK